MNDMKKTVQLCIVYNPPENSKYCNKDLYEELSTDLMRKSTSNQPVVLIGDFNSRTGSLTDFENTDDKHIEYTIGRKVFPKPRKNQDTMVNNMGKKLVEFCKAYDLQILNGRTTGDSTGSFTFYDTKQGASAIDLAIASFPIIRRVKTFSVNNPSDYSLHCKIELRLDNVLLPPEELQQEQVNYPWIDLGDKYIWREDSEEKFKEALKNPTVRKLAQDCNQYIEAGLVELASDKIIAMYIEAAKLSLETKKSKKRGNNNNAKFKHHSLQRGWNPPLPNQTHP